jgi:hypothetical protein
MIVVGLNVGCFVFRGLYLGPNWKLLPDGEIATASLVEDYGAHLVKSCASVGRMRI